MFVESPNFVLPLFVHPPATYPMKLYEFDATAAEASKGSGRSVVDSQIEFPILSFSVDLNILSSPRLYLPSVDTGGIQPPIAKT